MRRYNSISQHNIYGKDTIIGYNAIAEIIDNPRLYLFIVSSVGPRPTAAGMMQLTRDMTGDGPGWAGPGRAAMLFMVRVLFLCQPCIVETLHFTADAGMRGQCQPSPLGPWGPQGQHSMSVDVAVALLGVTLSSVLIYEEIKRTHSKNTTVCSLP